MPEVNYRSSAASHKLAWLIVLSVVLVSLAVSLSTRTFHTPSSTHAIRQHLNLDATEWTPPPPLIVVLEVSGLYPQMQPAEIPLPTQLFEDDLFTRPPPSC
jgi:hypothetical protein